MVPMGPVTIQAMEHPTAALPSAIPAKPDFEWLYRVHAVDVERWVARLAGPGFDVEDLVHEVFLVALGDLRKLRHPAQPATWLFAITERVVRSRRRREHFRRWFADGDGAAVDTLGPEPAPSPYDILEGKRAAELFYKALEGVRERYRSVLILFELEGLSGQDIANLKTMRVDTVWVWRHRARKQLLKRLHQLEGGSR